MPRLSIQVAAVLGVVFLLAYTPCLFPVFGDCINGVEEAAFLRGARAEAGGETGAETVDCVLPGQIRPLGSATYVTPGRTIKTTKKDCETRGGRPVAPREPGAEVPSGESAEQDVRVSPEGGKAAD